MTHEPNGRRCAVAVHGAAEDATPYEEVAAKRVGGEHVLPPRRLARAGTASNRPMPVAALEC